MGFRGLDNLAFLSSLTLASLPLRTSAWEGPGLSDPTDDPDGVLGLAGVGAGADGVATSLVADLPNRVL